MSDDAIFSGTFISNDGCLCMGDVIEARGI